MIRNGWRQASCAVITVARVRCASPFPPPISTSRLPLPPLHPPPPPPPPPLLLPTSPALLWVLFMERMDGCFFSNGWCFDLFSCWCDSLAFVVVVVGCVQRAPPRVRHGFCWGGPAITHTLADLAAKIADHSASGEERAPGVASRSPVWRLCRMLVGYPIDNG